MSNVLLSTVPKSGSHLMLYILGGAEKVPLSHGLEDQAMQIEESSSPKVWGHLLPRQEILEAASDRDTVFLHRDPRDILVSWLHHNEGYNGLTFISGTEYRFDELEFEDADDRLLWLIERVKPFYDELMEWAGLADYVVTYEGLMTNPMAELGVLAAGLGLDLETLVERSKYRDGLYYRKGNVGGWKDVFEPQHLEAYRDIWQ